MTGVCIFTLDDKGVFGGSLLCNVKRYGTALPPVLIKAMNHLRMEGTLIHTQKAMNSEI